MEEKALYSQTSIFLAIEMLSIISKIRNNEFIIENLEQYINVTHVTVIAAGDLNREFEPGEISISIPHCMFFITVKCEARNMRDMTHFGADCYQYNSITKESDFKEQKRKGNMNEKTAYDTKYIQNKKAKKTFIENESSVEDEEKEPSDKDKI
ncbi:11535_t:CDS:2 [Dentiscutata erythropus]|uniref:11535_t:CDS:1 n=1 Tax=Dentiscutata erythropus TaxID=1348616 RepID=A0A9N8ZT61_9GLOM|nr:11535_t:CDS:2 [Dentiscutata erythropus]